MPLFSCLHSLVDIILENFGVGGDTLVGVLADMFGAGNKFEVINFVVVRVAVLVVDVVPFWDRAIVVFPDDAVQPLVVSTKVALAWVEPVNFAVELLHKYSTSVSHKSLSCFHPFFVLILWSSVASICAAKLRKIMVYSRIFLRPLLNFLSTLL